MKKIRKQNELLRDIALEQPHLVCGPLVRIKGLLNLFTLDDSDQLDKKSAPTSIFLLMN